MVFRVPNFTDWVTIIRNNRHVRSDSRWGFCKSLNLRPAQFWRRMESQVMEFYSEDKECRNQDSTLTGGGSRPTRTKSMTKYLSVLALLDEEKMVEEAGLTLKTRAELISR